MSLWYSGVMVLHRLLVGGLVTAHLLGAPALRAATDVPAPTPGPATPATTTGPTTEPTTGPTTEPATTTTPATEPPPPAPAPPAGPTRHSRVVGNATVDLVLIPGPGGDATAMATAAFDELARVDALFSPDNAALSALVHDAGGPPWSIEPEVFAVLVEVVRVAKLSRGAFDPTAAAFAELWSDAATTDGDRRIVPAAAVLKSRKAVVGVDQLVLDPVKRTARLKTKGARLDISTVARGYALDRARGLLIERGATGFVLAVGGDVVTHGQKEGGPWVVGVQDPRAQGPFMTIAQSAALGGAVMTAVDTDGAFFVDGVRQHRLLDPKTGEPARQNRSVAVLGGDALTAKCLARAIFVLSPKEGLALATRHKGVEVVVVDGKNTVHLSPGLKKLGTTGAVHQRPPTDSP